MKLRRCFSMKFLLKGKFLTLFVHIMIQLMMASGSYNQDGDILRLLKSTRMIFLVSLTKCHKRHNLKFPD